jgi:hypothetical protein
MVGDAVGWVDGCLDGFLVGWEEGRPVGSDAGCLDGCLDGCDVGNDVGICNSVLPRKPTVIAFSVVPIIEPTPDANDACDPATFAMIIVVAELELTSNVTLTPWGGSITVSVSSRRADAIAAPGAVLLYSNRPVNACVTLVIFTSNPLGPYIPLSVCLNAVAIDFIAPKVGAPVLLKD